MKKPNLPVLILSLLSISSLTAHAGGDDSRDKGGNGGIVLACRQEDGTETIELADIKQVSLTPGLASVKMQNSDKSVDIQIDEAIARFAVVDKKVAETLKGLVVQIRANQTLVEGKKVSTFSGDTGALPIPENCSPRNAITYYNSQKIEVRKDLLNALSPTHQAALYLHEAIYAYFRKHLKSVTSELARKMTAVLFMDPVDPELLHGLMNRFFKNSPLSELNFSTRSDSPVYIDGSMKVFLRGKQVGAGQCRKDESDCRIKLADSMSDLIFEVIEVKGKYKSRLNLFQDGQAIGKVRAGLWRIQSPKVNRYLNGELTPDSDPVTKLGDCRTIYRSYGSFQSGQNWFLGGFVATPTVGAVLASTVALGVGQIAAPLVPFAVIGLKKSGLFKPKYQVMMDLLDAAESGNYGHPAFQKFLSKRDLFSGLGLSQVELEKQVAEALVEANTRMLLCGEGEYTTIETLPRMENGVVLNRDTTIDYLYRKSAQDLVLEMLKSKGE